MIKKKNIFLQFANNTSADIQMNILGGNSVVNDISNQTTQYRYDLTSETFPGKTNVSVQYKPVGGTFQTVVLTLPSADINGVLAALNSLGIATWFAYTSGPTQYITTYTDDYVFGDINIYSTNVVNFTWNNFTLTAGGANFVIQVDGVTVVNSANGSGDTGSFTAPVGAVIDVTGQQPPAEGGQYAEWENGVNTYTEILAAGQAMTPRNFNAASGVDYELDMGSPP